MAVPSWVTGEWLPISPERSDQGAVVDGSPERIDQGAVADGCPEGDVDIGWVADGKVVSAWARARGAQQTVKSSTSV
jgi:hypothetical protein